MSKLEALMNQKAALKEEIKPIASAEKAEELKEVCRLKKPLAFTHAQPQDN